ncbi:hypothetical protein [Streptomyces sp. NPDC048425]|uniref:hypothetical protein n=1 Tax=Streptomyces sp. NPDC048425 TaxID=3365548 RepID=UPI00371A70E5
MWHLPPHQLDGGPGAAGGGHLVLDVAQFLVEPASEQAALPLGRHQDRRPRLGDQPVDVRDPVAVAQMLRAVVVHDGGQEELLGVERVERGELCGEVPP